MALVANVLLVVLSLLMGLRLVRRYLARPRSHTLWYAVGLVLSALAALTDLYSGVTGSLPTVLWWSYWVCASALVGYLAVGTAYLISPRVGHFTLLIASLVTAWLLVATVMTAGGAPATLAADTLQHAPTNAIKLPFALQASLGAMVIFGGALWTFIKTKAWFAVWIGVGTLVFSSGGAIAGFLQFPGVFYFTQTAGIIILYLGITGSAGPVAPRAAATH